MLRFHAKELCDQVANFLFRYAICKKIWLFENLIDNLIAFCFTANLLPTLQHQKIHFVFFTCQNSYFRGVKRASTVYKGKFNSFIEINQSPSKFTFALWNFIITETENCSTKLNYASLFAPNKTFLAATAAGDHSKSFCFVFIFHLLTTLEQNVHLYLVHLYCFS